jgi:prophage antirepressor-like protein
MSNLIPFQFEEQSIRVLKEGDEPRFCVADVCAALEHTNPTKALRDLVEEDDLTTGEVIDSLGRKQTANFVNESGLYALIFGSRLEAAKRFKRWVTHDVLPALRKTGRYEMPSTAGRTRAEAMLLNAKTRLHRELMRSIDEINASTPLAPETVSAAKASITETTFGKALPALKPPTSVEWYTPTQIAEQLGVTSNRVGLIVSELGIRGNLDGVARAVLSKAAHSDKTVTTYQYSPRAVQLIAAKLPATVPEEAM